jgi:hypothetical protein
MAEGDNVVYHMADGDNLVYHMAQLTQLLNFHLRTSICIKHTPKWQKNINKYKKCM